MSLKGKPNSAAVVWPQIVLHLRRRDLEGGYAAGRPDRTPIRRIRGTRRLATAAIGSGAEVEYNGSSIGGLVGTTAAGPVARSSIAARIARPAAVICQPS